MLAPSRSDPRRALVLAAALLAGCATVVNPVTGQREVTLMSPQQEVATGRQAAAQVEREIGLVRDPALERYVDAIGQRLARSSPRRDVQYHFAIADMPEPNAFALPGGWIYVSRGLLAYANSEDELANVIGHEIGHVAARHAAQRQTRAAGVGVLSVLGTLAATVLGGGEAGQMVGQLGQVAGAGLIASYSRDQERQADAVGQEIAATSGWDPRGMASFLETLERQGSLHEDGARRPSFLDSHPAAGERAGVAARRAPALPRAGDAALARGRAAFLQRIAGLAVGPDVREGVFRDNLFLHPELGFAMRFPAGWRTRNTKQAVGAMAPRGDAVVVLEGQGPRGDPRDAAQRWVQANPVQVLESGPVRVGPWSGFRVIAQANTRNGVVGLHLTWIAHPGGTFRLTGMAPAAAWRAQAGSFDAVAASLRPLTSSERSGIRQPRLRVATARSGETLAALSRRTGNAWSVAETAVANAIPAGARLEAGTLVKVAVPESLR